MADSIGTKLSNINGEHFRMNYINVNHLVLFYDDIPTFLYMNTYRAANQPTFYHFSSCYKHCKLVFTFRYCSRKELLDIGNMRCAIIVSLTSSCEYSSPISLSSDEFHYEP